MYWTQAQKPVFFVTMILKAFKNGNVWSLKGWLLNFMKRLLNRSLAFAKAKNTTLCEENTIFNKDHLPLLSLYRPLEPNWFFGGLWAPYRQLDHLLRCHSLICLLYGCLRRMIQVINYFSFKLYLVPSKRKKHFPNPCALPMKNLKNACRRTSITDLTGNEWRKCDNFPNKDNQHLQSRLLPR